MNFIYPSGSLVHGSVYCAAVIMAQNYYEPASQMTCSVLYASELVVVYDVTRKPYNEKIADTRRKYALRDNSRIGAAYNYSVRRLTVYECPEPYLRQIHRPVNLQYPCTFRFLL